MIVVDPLVDCVPNANWRWDKSCHMSCQPGELDQLHAFARRIGLRRAWFQDKPNGLPHYDLNASKRKAAVAAGATEVDRRGIVAVMQEWREHRATELRQGALL